MGANHPISFCKDYQGGRSFYTGLGNTAGGVRRRRWPTHLKGAISWAAGQSDPVYSDCGATVLKNYQQVKVSAPPNLLEPIGFDQLPDGRMIQTARRGTVRLHDPVKGTTTVLANFADPALPQTMRVYTNSEDGLYGPARSTTTSPPTTGCTSTTRRRPSPNVKLSTGRGRHADHAEHDRARTAAASQTAWDPYVGYFQLSRFKFVDDDADAAAPGPGLRAADPARLQQPPGVLPRRG